MTCSWHNADGCSWGLGAGIAASGLFKAVGCVIDTSSNNKTAQQIANSQNKNQIYISNLTNQTNSEISQGNNLTQGQVANISAEAEIKAAEIQAAGLAAQKQPISSSTASLIFVGVILVVSIVGVFYLEKK